MYHASECDLTAMRQSVSNIVRMHAAVSKKSLELPEALRSAQHDVSSRQGCLRRRRLALNAVILSMPSGSV